MGIDADIIIVEDGAIAGKYAKLARLRKVNAVRRRIIAIVAGLIQLLNNDKTIVERGDSTYHMFKISTQGQRVVIIDAATNARHVLKGIGGYILVDTERISAASICSLRSIHVFVHRAQRKASNDGIIIERHRIFVRLKARGHQHNGHCQYE